MQFDGIVVGPLEVNCYILRCERTGKGVVIDPGGSVPEILDVIRRREIDVVEILNTHAHFDHTGGISELKEATHAPFAIHPDDLFLLEGMVDIAAFYGLTVGLVPTVDHELTDGEVISFGDERIRVLHTPGHSPGGVSFVVGDAVFCGDTLFAGSIGRTDFEGGSHEILLRSIRTKLFPLGDDTTVYPGHGPSTTIGQERRHNPFV